MFTLRNFSGFISDTLRLVSKGGRLYYAWVGFLLLLIAIGAGAYIGQLNNGLIVTKMRDQVSWGFYIGNFTFLVGVAAAAIMLVIPAYIYDWEPIKEITILGEMLAISALIMCLGFVMVDIGRPDRFWHIIPLVGRLNWPQSMLAWDVIVLNLYLLLNWFVVTYLLFCAYTERHYVKKLVLPLVLLSIPMAVSIHTVTAYLYNGLAARPFWNSAILAPRFLASAFCSGPAILLILLQVLRKTTKLSIKDEAIFKIAELMAYTMGFNLFLTAAEAFKELYLGHRAHGVLPVPPLWAQGPHHAGALRLGLDPLWPGRLHPLPGPPHPHQLGDAQYRLRAHLRQCLHREGHGPHHPGPHAGRAGGDLRLPSLFYRDRRGGGYLRHRLPGLHPDAQGCRAHDAG